MHRLWCSNFVARKKIVSKRKRRTDKVLLAIRSSPPKHTEAILTAKINFWRALCDDYHVSFTWPLSLKTAHQLVSKIQEAEDPIKSKYSAVQKMTWPVVRGELQGLVVKHIFPNPADEIKKSGRPSEFDKHLRAYALLEINRPIDKHQWGASAIATKVLKDNPDLIPKSQQLSNNSAEKALLSQHRKSCAEVEKTEQARRYFLSDRANAFMQKLDEDTTGWLLRLCELWSEIPTHSEDDDSVKSEMIAQWKALAVQVIPQPVLKEFFELFMSTRDAWIIAGQERQFYRPSEPNGQKKSKGRQFYRSSKSN